MGIAMESYSFYQFKSSIIALAVLCAARRAMQIKPFNHSELGMVGDNEESKQVNACFDRLWSKYHFKFPANAKTYSRYQPKDKKIISTLHFYFYYILLFQQQHLSKGARIKIIIITMTFVFL